MKLILNNKKLVLLVIAFLILFPLGLYGFSVITPQPLQTITPAQPSPTTAQTLPDDDPQKKRLEYVQTKKQLSVDDERAKFEILSTLGGSQSPILYQSQNITIDYVRSGDLFQAEILTTNIDIAKTEAVSWFKNKGLSNEGLCNLPLSFYLSYEIKTQLGESANSFDPTPAGC